MKLYAYSIVAQRQNGNMVSIYSIPGVVVCTNKNEAVGIALTSAKETWPQSDGYYGHDAVVIAVPDDFISIAQGFIDD